MVELYWPRDTTFTSTNPSGMETYTKGLHDVDEEQAEAFRERGWLDPEDDDVDVEVSIEDGEKSATEGTSAAEDEDDGEVELDEDELSLTAESPDIEDDTDDETEAEAEVEAEVEVESEDGDDVEAAVEDEFDAEAFVDRTPQNAVIEDIQSGEYDHLLDEIEAAEREGRDRRGVERALASRQDTS